MLDDDKTPEDVRLESQAHLGPGGPGEFVHQFVTFMWDGRYDRAEALIHPKSKIGDLPDLDLNFLREPGWGISGRPRLTPKGDEIVLYVHLEELDDVVTIETPMQVPAVAFVIRWTDPEWKMISIQRYEIPST